MGNVILEGLFVRQSDESVTDTRLVGLQRIYLEIFKVVACHAANSTLPGCVCAPTQINIRCCT